MIKESDPKIRPICDSPLTKYGTTKRQVLTEYGRVERIKIRRFMCGKCKMVHQELPTYLLPHKRYKAKIIEGFVKGELSTKDPEYENGPCEITVKQWIEEFGDNLKKDTKN